MTSWTAGTRAARRWWRSGGPGQPPTDHPREHEEDRRMSRNQAPSRRRAQGSERQARASRRRPGSRRRARTARSPGAPSMLRNAGSAVGKVLRGSADTVKEVGTTVIGTAREIITAAATARHDGVSVLKAQHREVEALFDKVLESDEARVRRELLQQIGDALALHTRIEEEIFYPAVRGLGGEETQALLDEALEEHHVVDLVLEELPRVNPRDARFTAKMTILSELVEHHVKEEE